MVPLVCHVAEPLSLRVTLVSFPMCGLEGLRAGMVPERLPSGVDQRLQRVYTSL